MAWNGTASPRQIPLRPGVYAPILTIFHPNREDLDLETQKKHVTRLAKDGLVGLVALGSNGEAVHLSPSEKTQVISSTREALDSSGFDAVPVIAGCSDQSVRGSVNLCVEAAKAGASYAMILPPCYYKPAMTDEVLRQFFHDVADKSPIPIMMYNYPGAVAGIDLNSELMTEIAKHNNVTGAKFTCASTGKLMRVAANTDAISSKRSGSGFLAAGGMADITVQTAVAGGSGVIAGTANVIPKFCVKVWDLCAQGKWDEAREQQKLLGRADWVLTKSGIPGTKAALQQIMGYGGVPRRPLPKVEGEKAEILARDLEEAFKMEKSL